MEWMRTYRRGRCSRDLKRLAGLAGIAAAKVAACPLNHACASHLLQERRRPSIGVAASADADISTTCRSARICSRNATAAASFTSMHPPRWRRKVDAQLAPLIWRVSSASGTIRDFAGHPFGSKPCPPHSSGRGIVPQQGLHADISRLRKPVADLLAQDPGAPVPRHQGDAITVEDEITKTEERAQQPPHRGSTSSCRLRSEDLGRAPPLTGRMSSTMPAA